MERKEYKVTHNLEQNYYNLSTDYKLLWDMINRGIKVPAWIWVYNQRFSTNNATWKLVEVKRINNTKYYSIGSRELIISLTEESFSAFENDCIFYSLHFVV